MLTEEEKRKAIAMLEDMNQRILALQPLFEEYFRTVAPSTKGRKTNGNQET